MKFMRTLPELVFFIVLLGFGLLCFAQERDMGPKFDVASIRPVQVEQRTSVDQPRPVTEFRRYATRIEYSNVFLSSLVLRAYGILSARRIVWPDRLEAEKWQRFTIQATFPEGTTESQIREMVQRLLEDRFALRMHWEKKAVAGYEVTVAPGGAKIPPSDYNPPEILEPGQDVPEEERNRNRYSFGPWMINGTMTIGQVVGSLEEIAGSPMVDKTGLKGYYEVDFSRKIPYSSPPPPPRGQPVTLGEASTPNGVDTKNLFQEIEKQLGLRVEAARLNMETLVLDHIERMPAEN